MEAFFWKFIFLEVPHGPQNWREGNFLAIFEAGKIQYNPSPPLSLIDLNPLLIQFKEISSILQMGGWKSLELL
jgi:hypothetical protein